MSAIDELKGLRRNGNMFKSALIFFRRARILGDRSSSRKALSIFRSRSEMADGRIGDFLQARPVAGGMNMVGPMKTGRR
jgi:hypothetical protein